MTTLPRMAAGLALTLAALPVSAAAQPAGFLVSMVAQDWSAGRGANNLYQRGYQDGLSGGPRLGNARAYLQGYQAGAQARFGQGGGAPLYGWYDNGWSRLQGRNTAEALSRLNNRGFVEVSNRKLGGEWVKEYWRRGSRECLVIRSAHNRINSIQPVDPAQCRY
ncbi:MULTISPECIES: hypothetical protein [Sphingomonas]|uniref:hypothetical protein n=1 Tax=Sphingomonas TaxID=13687 RepID=UPI001269D917|nr:MULTISPECIES: hypothetical protein [Sphingomonas]